MILLKQSLDHDHNSEYVTSQVTSSQKSGTKLLARAHAYTRMLFLYSSCNLNTNRDRHIVKFPNKK